MRHSDNIQIIRCEDNKDMVLVQMDRITYLNFIAGYGATGTSSRRDMIQRWGPFQSLRREIDFDAGIDVYSKFKDAAVVMAKELDRERRGEV